MRLRLSIRLRQAASDLASSDRVNVLHGGDLELDLVRRRVARLGKPIQLRPKEFLLLEYLVRNVNRPLTRTMILELVWNSSFEVLTNVVDVCISALPSKVDRDFAQKMIQTNRGFGYTFMCPSDFPPVQCLVIPGPSASRPRERAWRCWLNRGAPPIEHGGPVLEAIEGFNVGNMAHQFEVHKLYWSKGDIVNVRSKLEDGWQLARCIRGGPTGTQSAAGRTRGNDRSRWDSVYPVVPHCRG